MKDYRGECVLQPRSRFVAPSLFALLTRRVRRDLRDRVQHGDETDETHRHTQHNHRRDLQSRRLVRIKSQQTSLRRSSRVPLRVGRDDTSTHRTYARERTEAAQTSSVTHHHAFPRTARVSIASSSRSRAPFPRAHSIEMSMRATRFDARASSSILSRARSTARRVGNAFERASTRTHPTWWRSRRPRAVKCGEAQDRRLTFTLATVGAHGASRRRRASSGVRRRGARDRAGGGV
jgi:hypothetical protein